MPNGDWFLAEYKRHKTGQFEYVEVRPLSEAEQARIQKAMQLLRDFSGSALIGPLIDALNALADLLADLPNTGQAEYPRGQYRSKLNGLLSAALTAFTSFRATLEANSRAHGFPLPDGGSAFDNFRTLYREHPSFRLVHMLRNLDQHRPPASAVLTISADADPQTGESRVRAVLDVATVCARCAAGSEDDRHRVQWEECGALWEKQRDSVDICAVLEAALQACHMVLAAHVREAEPWVLQEVRFVADLVVEVEPYGSAHAVRAVRNEDGRTLTIDTMYLDPIAFGDAIATLDAARKMLGEPSLGETGLLPGGGTQESETRAHL